METYQIILIVLACVAAFVLMFFAVGGLAFFLGIFKRKPYSELGDKKHETEQRKFVKEERRKAIAYLRGIPCEKTEITAFDGTVLRGRLYKSEENGERRLVICVHGFTSHGLREFAAVTPYLNSLGLDALLVDDRAHGESDGKYSGFSVLDRIDVKGWVEKYKQSYEKIYLYGISMGAATVAMVAADMKEDISGVVFDCGFTSPADSFAAVMKKACPHLSGKPIFFFGRIWCKLILGFDFKKVSALEEIKKAECPFLFIQGDCDPTVPKEMSDRMFASCGSKNKRQEIFNGAEHVASLYVERERYEKLLKDFFGSVHN